MIFFESLAKKTTEFAGSTLALVSAVTTVIIWAIYAYFENFSTDSQMYINTGTTIGTWIMVFCIQRAQNKDSTAIQLKLNELIASTQGSSNRLLNIENLSEKEIEILRKRYKSLATRTKEEEDKTTRHTIEEIDDDD